MRDASIDRVVGAAVNDVQKDALYIWRSPELKDMKPGAIEALDFARYLMGVIRTNQNPNVAVMTAQAELQAAEEGRLRLNTELLRFRCELPAVNVWSTSEGVKANFENLALAHETVKGRMPTRPDGGKVADKYRYGEHAGCWVEGYEGYAW
jgi:hypothetical protein